MKIKIKDLTTVVEYFRYNAHIEDTGELEISIREEDFEQGKIMSSLTLTGSTTKPASKYDRIQSDKLIIVSVEIFPDSESRPPKVTLQESQDIGTL